MQLLLIFENTGDQIPLSVIYNHDMIEWFIIKADREGYNSFFNNDGLFQDFNTKLNDAHWAVSKTNEVYWLLSGETFPQNDNLVDYLDQRFTNRQHDLWVKSQYKTVDIDELRFSEDAKKAEIGCKLHEMYPDEIRVILMAEAMIKLGYIYPYEQVNKAAHHIEGIFSQDREWSASNKWADFGFKNPFVNKMVSNQDRVNFSFGYTYVGRQYFDKWKNWDTNLEFTDHYNYERLEWSFQLNLDRPQTLAWSPEFLQWTQDKKVKPVATQIPIANISDLEKNLTHYRKIIYNNTKQNNPIKLALT
jgi:hypothetical protein